MAYGRKYLKKSGDYMGLETIYQANFGIVSAHIRHNDGYLAIFGQDQGRIGVI